MLLNSDAEAFHHFEWLAFVPRGILFDDVYYITAFYVYDPIILFWTFCFPAYWTLFTVSFICFVAIADVAITQHAFLIGPNGTPIWGQFGTKGHPSIHSGITREKKNYIWIVTIWDKHFIYKRNFMLNSSIHFHLFFLCSLLFHDFQLHISLIKYSFFRSLCSGIFFFSFISSLERLFIGLISQDSKWSIKYGRILNESSIWKCVSFFEWCDRKKNVFNFQEVQKKGEPTDWIDAHWIFFPNSRLHIKLLYSNFWVSASLGKWFWNWNYEFHTLFICLFFSKAKLEHCAYAVNSGFRFKNGYVVVTSIS